MASELEQMRALITRIERSMTSPDRGLWLTKSRQTIKDRDRIIQELCENLLAHFPPPESENWEQAAFQSVLAIPDVKKAASNA